MSFDEVDARIRAASVRALHRIDRYAPLEGRWVWARRRGLPNLRVDEAIADLRVVIDESRIPLLNAAYAHRNATGNRREYLDAMIERASRALGLVEYYEAHGHDLRRMTAALRFESRVAGLRAALELAPPTRAASPGRGNGPHLAMNNEDLAGLVEDLTASADRLADHGGTTHRQAVTRHVREIEAARAIAGGTSSGFRRELAATVVALGGLDESMPPAAVRSVVDDGRRVSSRFRDQQREIERSHLAGGNVIALFDRVPLGVIR